MFLRRKHKISNVFTYSNQVANILSGLFKNVLSETRSILSNFLGQCMVVSTEINAGSNY